MNESDAPEVADTQGSTNEGPSGGASVLSLLVVLVATGLSWRRIGDVVTWWWDASDLRIGNGHSHALGALILFGLGMFGAVVVTLMILVGLARLLGFAGDLGSAFRAGWRKRSG